MARPRLGIAFGRDSATAVLLWPGRKAARVIRSAEVAVPPEIWDAKAPDFGKVFRDLARALGAAARRADVPVNVAIPDPLIIEEVVGFRDVPDDAAEAAALIRWRLARDYRRPEDELVCSHQKLPPGDGEVRFLARVIPRALRDAILDAGCRAGFRIVGLEGVSRFAETGGAGGPRLTVLATDADWAVLFQADVDDSGEVRAGWTGDDAPEETAAQIVRILKALAMAHGAQCSVTVEAPEPVTAALLPRIEAALGVAPGTGRPEISGPEGRAMQVALG